MTDRRPDITFLGRTDFRGQRRPFGIRLADRRSHVYVIGKTGTGKSTLLEAMVRQDIVHGHGIALLDPHGDLVERIRTWIPERRRGDVIDFDVPGASTPLGFNPLSGVAPQGRALAASGMLEVFKRLWADSWGPRLEHILRNALFCLLDQPRATLADILRLLDDKTFRKHAADRTANARVRDFWLREYEGYPARFRAEAVAPVQNKVGAFLAHPVLQSILTQERSAFDPRDMMDRGRLLLVNLAKGKLGEDAAALLGALLVSRIGVAGLSRVDVPEDRRRDFFVYLDEFQSFTTLSLATMLSELRKYRVSLVLGHQYAAQLDERVRDAILGNVGTTITFRVGSADAAVLEKEFIPEVRARDLVALPNHRVYLKLMVDGVVTRPFSAETVALR